jgi:hypothetical protein
MILLFLAALLAMTVSPTMAAGNVLLHCTALTSNGGGNFLFAADGSWAEVNGKQSPRSFSDDMPGTWLYSEKTSAGNTLTYILDPKRLNLLIKNTPPTRVNPYHCFPTDNPFQ